MRNIAVCALLFLRVFFISAGEKNYYGLLRDLSDEDSVLAFVQAEIEGSGGGLRPADFSDFAGGHSFSRILETSIPGVRPEILIIAAPAGAGEKSFNAATALSLWARCLEETPPVSLLFLFLGSDADENEALGSRLFLDSFFPEYPVSVLYLNFSGIPGRIICETGTRGIVAPSWMIRRVLDSAGDTDFSFQVQGNKNQMYRLRLSGTQSSAGRYLEAGFPTLSFENGGPPARAGDYSGWDAGFGAFFRNYLAQNREGIPDEWDQHYLFFQSGNFSLIIEEPQLIILLLSVVGASFLYALFARRRMIRYISTFVRNFWNLPLILALAGLFFLVSTLFVRGITAFRASPDLWTHHPFVFFLLKISSAMCLMGLSFHNLRRLPISKNGSFYSAAAIFFFFVNVLIFSVIDLSFSCYFLWAYVISIFFSLVKNRVVKLLLIFAAPLLLYRLVYDTFFLAEKNFAGVLINSPLVGNLLLSFIFFPLFLMVIRLDLLFRHPRTPQAGLGMKIFIGLTGFLSLGAAVFALTFNPYRNNPQPLRLEEYIDREEDRHELRLSSPSPLGRFEVKFGDKFFPVLTQARTYTITLESFPVTPLRSLSVETFLERRTCHIAVSPVFQPQKISLSLFSDNPLVIYDSNFPYSRGFPDRQAEIHIGVDPPVPLNIILTVPDSLNLRGELIYRSPRLSAPLDVSGKTLEIESYSKIRDSFTMSGAAKK
jgi:hypothetical protein